MRKIIAAAVVVILAAAGAAYFLLQKNVTGNVEAGIRTFFANLPADYTKRAYGKVTVDLASQSATIEAIDVERKDGFKVKIDKLEVANVDEAAIRMVFDPNSYKGPSDATFRRLAGAVAGSGVHVEDGGKATDIAKFTILNIQGRQFPAAPTAEWRATLKDDQRGAIILRTFKVDSADFDQVIARGKDGSNEVRKMQLNAVNGTNLGRVLIEGMKFSDPVKNDSALIDRMEIGDLQWEKLLAEQAEGRKPADFAATLDLIQLGRVEIAGFTAKSGKDATEVVLPKLTLSKMDNQGIDSLTFSGLIVRNAKDDTDISIGEFDMGRLNWGGLFGAMGKGQKAVLDVIGKRRDWVERISISKIGGPTLDKLGLAIDQISITAKAGADVDQSLLKISGLAFDGSKAQSMEIKQMFQMLEYQRVVFDVAIGGSIDRKAKSFALDQFSIAAPQVGALNLNLALDDFVEQTDPNKTLDAFLTSSLKGLKLSYEDAGLVPKLLKVGAQMQGMTEEQLRMVILEQVSGLAEMFKQVPALVVAAEAVRKFLEKPRSLVLTAAPAKPVPLMQVGMTKDDPPALIELLNLTLIYK